MPTAVQCAVREYGYFHMTQATFWKVCTKKQFEVDGETKEIWREVGDVKFTPNGSVFLNLSLFPNTTFYVFKNKDKDEPLPEIH